ncbi:MAG: 6-pyruvoyl trahydropterin synthase family protein [Anaerolineales bacterium]
MYMVAVKRDFKARHFLIGGDWGPENDLHEHHYQVEVQLEGETLDQHGYLVDIVDIENHLDALVENYRGKILNDFAEFAGLNPSIENFSRIMCLDLSSKIAARNISALTTKIWENDIAWASFRITR